MTTATGYWAGIRCYDTPAAERKINTHYWAKPIPLRQFDWSAAFDDSEDDDCLVGHGATEAEAIQDLNDQVSS